MCKGSADQRQRGGAGRRLPANDSVRLRPLPILRPNVPPPVTKGRQIETEAAPIRYVAELVGADTDSERATRRSTTS